MRVRFLVTVYKKKSASVEVEADDASAAFEKVRNMDPRRLKWIKDETTGNWAVTLGETTDGYQTLRQERL